MFSAFKRLVGNQNENRSGSDEARKPTGVQIMDYSLQRKFAKGVQYNMKIILKGDRNVGKTCLFHRLQGDKFKEEYVPTEEIQVTSIQWNYKATDDVVKVEVWDIVDKGKKRKQNEGLKFDNKPSRNKGNPSQDEFDQPALDAEFVDVYKGTNGVVMLLDMTKAWTFDYIQRELPKVPKNLPVLVLANHRDMGHHRAVTEDQVRTFVESLDRGDGSGQVRYAEASMRNGFGLKFLHRFFNLPFLHLQRETLVKQLETNADEIKSTCTELDVMQESDDQDYDSFLEMITDKRRQIADQLSQIPNTESDPSGPPRSKSVPANLAPKVNEPFTAELKPTPSIIIGANNPLPIKNITTRPMSSVNGVINQDQRASITSQKDDLDEDQLRLKSFLDEAIENDKQAQEFTPTELSDSEDETQKKPIVSGYQHDLDPEDMFGEPADASSTLENEENESHTNHVESTPVPVASDSKQDTQRMKYPERTTEQITEETPEEEIGNIEGEQASSKRPEKVKEALRQGTGKSEKKKGKKKRTKKRSSLGDSEDEKKKLEEFLGGNFASVDASEYEAL